VVIGSDVPREQLGMTGFVLGTLHRIVEERNRFLIGANTWLPCGSSFLMKSPPSQNWRRPAEDAGEPMTRIRDEDAH
jgi:hypothetical protein